MVRYFTFIVAGLLAATLVIVGCRDNENFVLGTGSDDDDDDGPSDDDDYDDDATTMSTTTTTTATTT